MPVVRELAAEEVGDLNEAGSTERRGYLVDTSADKDPRYEPGVPQLGQFLVGLADQSGLAMPCSSVVKDEFVTRYTNTGGDDIDRWKVIATFTSPELTTPIAPLRDYPEWGVSFAREAIAVPFFIRVPRLIGVPIPQTVPPGSPPGTPLPPPQSRIDLKYEWVPRPYQLLITYMIYKQVVYIDDVDQRDLMVIRSQVGRIHHFGLDYGIVPLDAYTSDPVEWDRRKLPWQFQPPSIFMVRPRRFRIEYAWINDPGNQAIVDDITSETIAPTAQRPPFWRYDVQLSTNASDEEIAPELVEVTPKIYAVPMFSEASGWIDPQGYQQLVGNVLQ